MSQQQIYGPVQMLGKSFSILHNKIFVNTDYLSLRGTLVSWEINQHKITTGQLISQVENLPVALKKPLPLQEKPKAIVGAGRKAGTPRKIG